MAKDKDDKAPNEAELAAAQAAAEAELKKAEAEAKEAEDNKPVKVKMQTQYASARGTCAIGKCIILPKKEALALVEGGYAELAGKEDAVVPPQAKVEAEANA